MEKEQLQAAGYPSPHSTKEKITRSVGESKAKKVAKPFSDCLPPSTSASTYPEAYVKKESVNRPKNPPKTTETSSDQATPHPPPTEMNDAVERPHEQQSAELGLAIDDETEKDASESPLETGSNHSASRPQKKSFWFFRKPNASPESQAADNEELPTMSEIDPPSVCAASADTSHPEDSGQKSEERTRKSASYWPFRKRADDAPHEEATEVDEKSNVVESLEPATTKQPMTFFRKKNQDGTNLEDIENSAVDLLPVRKFRATSQVLFRVSESRKRVHRLQSHQQLWKAVSGPNLSPNMKHRSRRRPTFLRRQLQQRKRSLRFFLFLESKEKSPILSLMFDHLIRRRTRRGKR
jgi:hypothetical protein